MEIEVIPAFHVEDGAVHLDGIYQITPDTSPLKLRMTDELREQALICINAQIELERSRFDAQREDSGMELREYRINQQRQQLRQITKHRGLTQ